MDIIFRSLCVGLAASLSLGAGVLAMRQAGNMVTERFKVVDRDANGKLSLEEAQAGMPRLAQRFETVDKDKTGDVTLDELKVSQTPMGG